jgi:hypothetical protein
VIDADDRVEVDNSTEQRSSRLTTLGTKQKQKTKDKKVLWAVLINIPIPSI